MADLDFLDGFDSGGDWGFTSVSEKPSDTAKKTETVVKQTAEGTAKAVSGELVSRLESKLDKIYSAVNSAKSEITNKNETELNIAKKQMDDEYDLRKDNLGKEMKDKFSQLEKLVIPLMLKLAKAPENYIYWPNRKTVIEAQLKKIVAITRGK